MMRKIITMLFLVGIMFFGTISDGKTAKALSGKGTADDPFLVSTAQDLRTVTADLKGYYLQTADIDLKYQDFPIIAEYDNPGFQGTYDGNNFKIKNLKIQKSELPLNTGLFGRCDNATIKRVHLVNVEIENTTNKSGYLLGGIVGKAVNTTISDCHVTGEGYIKNGLKAGGIAGWIQNCIISNCSVSVPLINNTTSGGIVGYGIGTCSIVKSYSNNNIDSKHVSSATVGGILGEYNGHNLTISECYSSGNLLSYYCNGGILGKGSNQNYYIENCFSISDIKTNKIMTYAANAGGIVGMTSSIKIINSYFAGTLNGEKNYGLSQLGKITNSYFDGEKNNNVNSYKYSKNTCSMYRQESFVDWDFDNVWKIEEEKDYPYLKELSKPSRNLAINAEATASSYYTFKNSNPSKVYIPSKGNDEDELTYWKSSNYNEGDIFYQLSFPIEINFNKIEIKEYGNEINEYKVQIKKDGEWLDIDEGIGIGNSYSKITKNYTTKQIRLLIVSRVSNQNERLPGISEFKVYNNLN